MRILLVFLSALLFFGCYYDYILEDEKLKQNYLWPDGKVPFSLVGFNDRETSIIFDAMCEWSLASEGKIKFHPILDTKKNKITIIKYSNFGYVGLSSCNGYEDKNEFIVVSVVEKEIILHELGHILGLLHEFQRPDAVVYIDIKLNTMPGFDIFSFCPLDAEYFIYDYKKYPFDYNSIMFSGYERFFVKKDSSILEKIRGLSIIDAWKIQDLYGKDYEKFIH